MLFNELPTAFPFYDKIEHQNRYRLNVAGRADLPGGYLPIDLNCPKDAYLPFEFYVTGNINPTTWTIYREKDDTVVATVNVNQLNSTFLAGVNRKYFYHDGRIQQTPLPIGSYYFGWTFPGNIKKYSEIFHVCDFTREQPDNPFLKLQWYNDHDLNPIFYNDKVNGVPIFTNVLWLDTYIHEYEPELVDEPETDGLGKPYQGFTLANMRYRITLTIPGYLKKAMVLIPMHDHVFITTPGVEHRTGEIERISTNTETVLNGSFANIDLIFEESFLQKSSCPNNMV